MIGGTSVALTLYSVNLFAQGNIPRVTPIDFAAAKETAQEETSRAIGDCAQWPQRTRHSLKLSIPITYGRMNTGRSFEWQFWTSIVIFLAVLAMMLSGLYFSYMQFKMAKRAETPTHIKLGKDGFEISSSVIGLLILFISMGFFYMYLSTVYPITEVIGASSSQTSESRPSNQR